MNVEEEVSLPKATINTIIKEILPPDVKCSPQTRDFIHNCALEFVHLVSAEANDISQKDNKKTLSAEYIIKALESLGFSQVVAAGEKCLQDFKEVKAARPPKKKDFFQDSNMTAEELLKEQQRLFAGSRATMGSSLPATPITPSTPLPPLDI
eukprot:GCRY01003139.1.p1 GENE.GCRY01003139.1~~GCRY01003139.1.p1  ORF type:complete len:152 (-),score=32.90 GCRY01003139.1:162-617(-)